jgi:hypothetical protein
MDDFFIAIFGQMIVFLFISKIRINFFSVKDHTKNTDNVFVYIFKKNCANFAQVGRMKVKNTTFFKKLRIVK